MICYICYIYAIYYAIYMLYMLYMLYICYMYAIYHGAFISFAASMRRGARLLAVVLSIIFSLCLFHYSYMDPAKLCYSGKLNPVTSST